MEDGDALSSKPPSPRLGSLSCPASQGKVHLIPRSEAGGERNGGKNALCRVRNIGSAFSSASSQLCDSERVSP